MNLIAGSFCVVIQGVINTVINIMNAFPPPEGPIAHVNFGCPSVRRSSERGGKHAADDQQGISQALEILFAHRTTAINSADSDPLQTKRERLTQAFRNLGIELSSKRPHHRRSASSDEPEELINLSLSEGQRLLAEAFEWTGDSLCDRLVQEVGRDPYLLEHVLEESHYIDCIVRRTLGELISIMPVTQWFPPDGFYNSLAWLRLSVEAVQALNIYTQYQRDHSLPYEVVLSETYRESWRAAGLRVDHLEVEKGSGDSPLQRYRFMLDNLTLADYFERNDANYALIESMLNLRNGLLRGGGDLIEYMTTLALEVNATSRTPLELWLYGYDQLEEDLPREKRLTQSLWRSALQTFLAGVNLTRVAATAAYDVDLAGHTLGALQASTHLAGRFVNWMASEPTPEWEEALRARDHALVQHGFISATHREHVASGIFGRAIFENSAAVRLRAWIAERAMTGLSHLRPNSPRARRNWAIIVQFWSDFRRAMKTGFLPSRTGGRSYTPQYVVETFDSETQQPIHSLANCDTTLVPFCLDCLIVDGTLHEAAVAALEFESYFDDEFSGTMALFNATRDYIGDTTVNVCGGSGADVITWPSSIELVPGVTVLDVFGHPDGAFMGLTMFLSDELFPRLGDFTLSAFYALGRRIVLIPEELSMRLETARASRMHTQATPPLISTYAASYTGFDPTYAITKYLPVTTLLQFMDDLSSGLDDISFAFNIEPNPFGNGTVTLPVILDPGNSTSGSFLVELFKAFVARDFTYTCARRNMSLFQGVLLVGALAVFALLVFYLVGRVISETMTVLLIAMFAIPVIYFGFFIIVYGVPAQNLLFLPLPVLPECFADDVIELLFCDLLPKCPAVIAGLIDGVYSEANCRTRPLDVEFLNCKHDLGIDHGFDVLVLLLQWWLPGPLEQLRNEMASYASSLESAGLRLDRFLNVDFTDQVAFDSHVTCAVVMMPTLLVSLFLLGIVLTTVGATVFSFIVGLAAVIIQALMALFYLMQSIVTLFIYNLVYVVTPGDLETLDRAVERWRAVTSQTAPEPSLTFSVGASKRFAKTVASASRTVIHNLSVMTHLDGLSHLWRASVDPLMSQFRRRPRHLRHRDSEDDAASPERSAAMSSTSKRKRRRKKKDRHEAKKER
jgi:hypothetical protein